jgi:hypothetical protein
MYSGSKKMPDDPGIMESLKMPQLVPGKIKDHLGPRAEAGECKRLRARVISKGSSERLPILHPTEKGAVVKPPLARTIEIPKCLQGGVTADYLLPQVGEFFSRRFPLSAVDHRVLQIGESRPKKGSRQFLKQDATPASSCWGFRWACQPLPKFHPRKWSAIFKMPLVVFVYITKSLHLLVSAEHFFTRGGKFFGGRNPPRFLVGL